LIFIIILTSVLGISVGGLDLIIDTFDISIKNKKNKTKIPLNSEAFCESAYYL